MRDGVLTFLAENCHRRGLAGGKISKIGEEHGFFVAGLQAIKVSLNWFVVFGARWRARD